MRFLPNFTPELELPKRIEDATPVLKECFLPQAEYAGPFGFLVAVLVSVERMKDQFRRKELLRDLGEAFNGFGNGDDVLGLKYMSAAGQAAKVLYDENMWDLNLAWSGIGNWRA